MPFRFSIDRGCCERAIPLIFIGTWDSCVNYSCEYWKCISSNLCNRTSQDDGNPSPNTRDEQYGIDKQALADKIERTPNAKFAFGNLIGGGQCWSRVDAINPPGADLAQDSFGDFEFRITNGSGQDRITFTDLKMLFEALYAKFGFSDNNQEANMTLFIDNSGSITEGTGWSAGTRQEFIDWLRENYPRVIRNVYSFRFVAPYYERYLKIVEQQYGLSRCRKCGSCGQGNS